MNIFVCSINYFYQAPVYRQPWAGDLFQFQRLLESLLSMPRDRAQIDIASFSNSVFRWTPVQCWCHLSHTLILCLFMLQDNRCSKCNKICTELLKEKRYRPSLYSPFCPLSFFLLLLFSLIKLYHWPHFRHFLKLIQHQTKENPKGVFW